MIWTFSVQLGKSPFSIDCTRSVLCDSGSMPAISMASSVVSVRMPWSVLKWYFTKNCSPAALSHWKVWDPKPSMWR